MSPEERQTLDLLLKKQDEEQAGATVIQLLPGGKQDDTPLVQKLRDILRAAERGHFEEFVFVGLASKDDSTSSIQGAQLVWAGPLTLQMLGALSKSVALLMK